MKWFTIIKMNSSYNVFIDNVQTEVMKVADAFADTLSEYLKRIDCWDPEDFEFIYSLRKKYTIFKEEDNRLNNHFRKV